MTAMHVKEAELVKAVLGEASNEIRALIKSQARKISSLFTQPMARSWCTKARNTIDRDGQSGMHAWVAYNMAEDVREIAEARSDEEEIAVVLSRRERLATYDDA